MKAASGDKLARLKWKRIKTTVAILKIKAKKGDPKAKHDLAVLDDSGLLGHVQTISGIAESKDQDIIDRLILRSGSAAGWPVYISKAQYADYQSRAAKKDTRAVEILSILDRYSKDGRLKISDDKKGDQSRYPIGGDDGNQERRQLEEQARRGNIKAILKLKRIRQEEALTMHGNLGSFVGSDELELARDGGASERAALARTSGIVISDREIKDAMRGSLSLVEGRSRHRHHRRRQIFPGISQNQSPGQATGLYNLARDSRKSQIVRNLYQQIKSEHINWMTNLDHQNNVWNQTPDRYQQAARAWARNQLQQQQLPTRLTPAGTNPWVQPVSWFQSQAQAVLNATAGQRSAAINSSLQNPANPYPLQSSYVPYSAPLASPAASNAYYPAPGGSSPDDPSLYDDDQEGWPSPLLMHGDSFIGDEERAQGEDSGKWHWGSPFRKIGRGFKKVGRGFEKGLKTTGLVAVEALKSAPMALSHGDLMGGALSHNEYRALVLNQAIKKAGGGRPDTRHLFAAKKAVDSALGRSGTSIYIPGAGPARRTV
jgi:hypothetical protein